MKHRPGVRPPRAGARPRGHPVRRRRRARITGDHQRRCASETGIRRRVFPSRARLLLLRRRRGRGEETEAAWRRARGSEAHPGGAGVPGRIGAASSGDNLVSIAVRRQVRRRTGEQMSPGRVGITGAGRSRGSCRRSIRAARCARSSALCSDTGETAGSRSRQHRK